MQIKREFDHITLCSPSGSLLDAPKLDLAVRALGEYSLPIIEQPNTRSRFQRFAGTDADRIQAIQMACGISQSSLILATRGGYGLTRLLDQIDLDQLAANLNLYQHLFSGHSDITALQLALLQAGAQPSTLLHGPMACFDFGEEEGAHPETKTHFDRAVFEGKVRVGWQMPALHNLPSQFNGPVWGGNLAMICSLMGTPWQPKISDGILVLEDVNEPAYKLERMLLQLDQSGILSKQALIVMGQFGPCKPTDHDNGYDFESVFALLRDRVQTPVLTHFPFGHVTPKACWFQGAIGQVDLSVSNDLLNCRLEQTIAID